MNCDAYHVFFKNLANPVKTKILKVLLQGKRNVSDIVFETGLEQSKISHALANLKFCHIVEIEQTGKNRIYSLNKKTIVPILNIIDEHRKNFCPGCKK